MDYKYIRAWGAYMGSFDYYVNDQVAQARKDNAPEDAIYCRDGKWATFSGVKNEDLKAMILNHVEYLKHYERTMSK